MSFTEGFFQGNYLGFFVLAITLFFLKALWSINWPSMYYMTYITKIETFCWLLKNLEVNVFVYMK